MSRNTRSGEHVSSFTTQSAARHFAHMIAANVRFEAVEVRPQCDFWLVTWRSRARRRQVQGVRS